MLPPRHRITLLDDTTIDMIWEGLLLRFRTNVLPSSHRWLLQIMNGQGHFIFRLTLICLKGDMEWCGLYACLLSRSQFIENYATIYDRRYSGQRVNSNENDTEDGSKNVTAVIFFHLVWAQKKKSYPPDTSDESLQSTRSIPIDLRQKIYSRGDCVRILATHAFSSFYSRIIIIHIADYYKPHKWARMRRRHKSKLFGEPIRLLKFIELAFITWKSVMQISRTKTCGGWFVIESFFTSLCKYVQYPNGKSQYQLQAFTETARSISFQHTLTRRPMLEFFFFFSHRREQPIDL